MPNPKARKENEIRTEALTVRMTPGLRKLVNDQAKIRAISPSHYIATALRTFVIADLEKHA
jgi:hypothetical protein